MKKILSVLTVFVLSTACLFGCFSSPESQSTKLTYPSTNSNSTTANTTVVTTPPEPTVDSLAGDYRATLWFLDLGITLNTNATFDYSFGAKGTISIESDNGKVWLKRTDYRNEVMRISGDYLYLCQWELDEDNDYGAPFSPDANGMTDQTFEACILNEDMPGCDYNRLILDLNFDGTYELKLCSRTYSSSSVGETYNGTYSYQDGLLTLEYNGSTYDMVVVDGIIYTIVFERS